jgi:hypothetical protein
MRSGLAWLESNDKSNVGLGPKILPSLFVRLRCGRLVETLPAMQHDLHRREDVLKVDWDEDGVCGDDAADRLRYLVATKERTVASARARLGYQKLSPGALSRTLGKQVTSRSPWLVCRRIVIR